MSTWLIEPRDPIIFRDGKPFSGTPGGRAESMAFPFPSTIAGGLRSNAGSDPKTGYFDMNMIGELLATYVRGPVLVELDYSDGKPVIGENWLFPAPADALLLRDEDRSQARRLSLHPLHLPSNTASNLTDGLSLVGTPVPIKEKPLSGAPTYWRWQEFAHWLENPADGLVSLNRLGHHGPTAETRTHVSIDPKSFSAIEGDLFQTSGLEFLHVEKPAALEQQHQGGESGFDVPISLQRTRPLALAVETNANCHERSATLGGERRIVQWTHTQEKFPSCPEQVRASILQQKGCRLILATPACFSQGYLPTWVLSAVSGTTVTIKGVATHRYQVVSGWDYEKMSPKPTRRLVPRGAVYFLSFDHMATDDAINAFIDTVWMCSISDEEQDRLDGFGLATLGAWQPKLSEVEIGGSL